MTKKEIINETVEFYSADVSRRASSGTQCHYSIMKNGVEKNCSVGRCMTPEAIECFKESFIGVHGICIRQKSSIDSVLRPEYHGHTEKFWSSLQKLHDEDMFWNDQGISAEGQAYVQKMLDVCAD